jgi:hypothetical protein
MERQDYRTVTYCEADCHLFFMFNHYNVFAKGAYWRCPFERPYLFDKNWILGYDSRANLGRPRMSSTVTTTTVTTITSVTSVTNVALMASFSLVLIVTLLSFLLQREILVVPGGGRLSAWRKALDAAIPPLVMGFVLIAIVRVIEALAL